MIGLVNEKHRQCLKHKNRQDLGIIARCNNVREVGKRTFFSLLDAATSAINRVFISATSFDHTQLCHVLPQSRMLELSAGKGRQVCRSWMIQH